MKRKFKIIFATMLFCILACTAAMPTLASEIQTDSEIIADAENIFTVIYESLLAHSAQIFSFLSLIGTMVISLFYKRGLLPSVKSTLGSLGSMVVKIKESTDRQAESQNEHTERTRERLDEFENTLALYGESLRALEEHLETEEQSRLQREKSDKILLSQIDMLYDIFMTSSIPHFQKEATGERINRMRKEIESYEDQ